MKNLFKSSDKNKVPGKEIPPGNIVIFQYSSESLENINGIGYKKIILKAIGSVDSETVEAISYLEDIITEDKEKIEHLKKLLIDSKEINVQLLNLYRNTYTELLKKQENYQIQNKLLDSRIKILTEQISSLNESFLIKNGELKNFEMETKNLRKRLKEMTQLAGALQRKIYKLAK